MGRIEEKALLGIQLYLAPQVLREVLNKTTAVDLWAQLDELYMTKSLANKIRLKASLYTFKMAEGTLVQKHLNDFNSIIVDLGSLDVKVEDENQQEQQLPNSSRLCGVWGDPDVHDLILYEQKTYRENVSNEPTEKQFFLFLKNKSF